MTALPSCWPWRRDAAEASRARLESYRSMRRAEAKRDAAITWTSALQRLRAENHLVAGLTDVLTKTQKSKDTL